MVSLSEDQFRALMEQLTQRRDHQERDRGGVMEERPFRRLEMFDGKEENWKEWSFNFTVAIGEADRTGGTTALIDILEKLDLSESTTEAIEEELTEET